MNKETLNVAIGVFLGLVAFRLFELILQEISGGSELPVLLVVVVTIAVVVLATSKKGVKVRR
jgi:hypothetical protein